MQNQKLPIIIIVAGLSLAALATVWVIMGNQPGQQQVAQPPAESDSGIPFPEIERISVDQAYEIHKTGKAVFIDVRDLDSYQSTHIAGAVFIPLGELETSFNELDTAQPVIPY